MGKGNLDESAEPMYMHATRRAEIGNFRMEYSGVM